MPSEWMEEIKDWPDFQEPTTYPVRVLSLKKSSLPWGIRICIEHLGIPQKGRQQEIELPMPVHPGNLTHQLFMACGMGTDIGQSVSPMKALGCTVLVRFRKIANGHEVSGFGPSSTE